MLRIHVGKYASLLNLTIVAVLGSSISCSKKDDGDDDASKTESLNVPTSGGKVAAGGAVAIADPTPYETKNIPGSLAIEIPPTLTKQDGTASLRLLGDEDSNEASGEKSEGYSHLIEQTTTIPEVVADLSERLYELDTAMDAINAECASRLGASWTQCTTASSVTAVFDEATYAGVLNAVGTDLLTNDDVDAFNARVGEEVDLGLVTVTKFSAANAAFDQCISLVVDENNTTKYCFDSDNVSVEYLNEEKNQVDTDSDGNPVYETTFGSHSLAFNPSEQRFHLATTLKVGSDEVITSDFVMKKDARAADLRGVFFNAKIEERTRGNGAFIALQSGVADDNGGYVDTKYTWYAANANSVTLSGDGEQNASYGIFPSTQAVSLKDFQTNNLFGFFYGSGTDSQGTATSMPYFGPVDGVAGMKIWKYSEDTGTAVVTDTGLTVTAIGIANDAIIYDEEFSGEGFISFWSYRYTEDGAIEGTQGESGEYAEKYRALNVKNHTLDL